MRAEDDARLPAAYTVPAAAPNRPISQLTQNEIAPSVASEKKAAPVKKSAPNALTTPHLKGGK
jgi:hypothetical protein